MKRKIPLFKLEYPGRVNPEIIYNNPTMKKVIFEELLKAVKEGIKYKKKSVVLFEIYGSDYVIELKKEDWVSSLQSAINYLSSQDEYEKCIEIQKMIKQINKV